MSYDKTPPEPDPNDSEIVAEVRAVRCRLAATVDFDLDRLFEQIKAIENDERARGHVIVPSHRYA